jgi:hypothetical protein
MWIIAQHTIQDNIAGNFTMGRIDPETGAHKLIAATRVTPPGAWVDFPDDEGARLLKLGAAREPTAQELQLRRLAGLPTE